MVSPGATAASAALRPVASVTFQVCPPDGGLDDRVGLDDGVGLVEGDADGDLVADGDGDGPPLPYTDSSSTVKPALPAYWLR
jgi:hypothetical protein